LVTVITSEASIGAFLLKKKEKERLHQLFMDTLLMASLLISTHSSYHS